MGEKISILIQTRRQKENGMKVARKSKQGDSGHREHDTMATATVVRSSGNVTDKFAVQLK